LAGKKEDEIRILYGSLQKQLSRAEIESAHEIVTSETIQLLKSNQTYGNPIEYPAVPYELLPQQRGFSFFEGPYITGLVA
jgi:hypothetical protein